MKNSKSKTITVEANGTETVEIKAVPPNRNLLGRPLRSAIGFASLGVGVWSMAKPADAANAFGEDEEQTRARAFREIGSGIGLLAGRRAKPVLMSRFVLSAKEAVGLMR